MIEKPLVGVVTARQHKWQAVKNALSGYETIWLPKPHFDEKQMRGLPHNFTRPFRISEGKAEHDLLNNTGILGGFVGLTQWLTQHGFREEIDHHGSVIGVYSDTLRFVPEMGVILSQPETREQWLEQAMLQRGTEVWICTAYTLEAVNKRIAKQTFGISTRVRTHRFEKDQALALGKVAGIENLMKVCGGLPLEQARDLYDSQAPLRVFYHQDLNDFEGRQIAEISSWNLLPAANLLPYYTGALAEGFVPALSNFLS